MKQSGAISKCENCQNYKDAKYPLCISCNRTTGNTTTRKQRAGKGASEGQSRRRYDTPQADTFAQRSAMLEEDQKAKDKRQLFEDQQYKCIYCGNEYKYDELQIEHMIPKTRGGQDNIRNSQLACRTCNQAKGTLTDIAFRQRHPNLLPQKERTPASPPINPTLLR